MKLAAGQVRTLKAVSADGAAAQGVLVLASALDHPLGFTDAAGLLTLAVPATGSLAVELVAADGRRAVGTMAAFPAADSTAGAADANPLRPPVRGPIPRAPSPRARRETPPPPPRVFTLPERQAVRGRLIDARDRRAIAGGLVWIDGELGGASLTDASGSFSLRGPVGRSIWLAAGAPGYMRPDPVSFLLAADARPGPTIALRAGAAIEGTVLDESGRPVAGAQASLEEHHDEGRMIIRIGRDDSLARAVTTARGTFRLSPVDPAKLYDLKVRAAGFAPASQPIAGLEARRTMGGLRIVLDRGQAITGLVTDGDGRPVRDADVSVRPARKAPAGPGRMVMIGGPGGGAAPPVKGTTGEDGRFRIAGLAAGTYDVEVRKAGFAKKPVAGVEVTKRSEPVDLGAIALEPGQRIFGFVSAPDGTPVEGVEISLAPAAAGPTMVLAGRPMDRQAPVAVSAPDGSFQVEDLRAGEPVALSFNLAGWLPGRENVPEVPRAEPVLVTLKPSSRVSGTVLGPDRKPVAGAEVNLSRSMGGGIGGEAFRMITREGATADDEGRFEFKSVSPGTISLSAGAAGWQDAKLDGIEVPQGKDVEGLELPLKRGASISGRVLAPDGRPVIGAQVGPVTDDPDPIRMGGAMSDGDGWYRVDGLAPGRLSIEATHDDYVRTVKELEARPGSNALNLQFEGGQEVSGTVTDSAGAPIAGAWVRLAAAGRDWGGPETKSGADGSFKCAGVGDGDYAVQAGREGFAPSDGETRVQVAGKPVTGLRVSLGAGGSIVGTISGLDREKLAQVDIRAGSAGRGAPQSAAPDARGDYRLEHLLPGTWTVTASVPDTGQQARGQVTLEPGAAEARLDLQFGQGLTLSGRALAGDAPVTGAVLYAQGTDIDHSGWGRTGADGGFRIEGLAAGSYRVELRQWETGLSHDETVELSGSREVTLRIPTAKIAGRVVDGTDRRGVSGATVTLARPGETEARGPLQARSATSDLDGRFTLANVPDGQWTLTANRGGYAAAGADVSVDSGSDVDGVTIALDATDGLVLEARLPSGRAPDSVDVAVLDGGGRAVLSGSYSTGENGRVRLSSVPAGTWDIAVGAIGSGTMNLRASAPGPPLPVLLPPACTLRITVPALAGSATAATARILGADGRPYRALGWMGEPTSQWRLAAGRLELDTLPPGTWTVQVTAADGQSWSATATTQAGAAAEATLR